MPVCGIASERQATATCSDMRRGSQQDSMPGSTLGLHPPHFAIIQSCRRDARHCCHGGQAGHADGVPTNIDRRQGGGLECCACVQKSKPAFHADLVQRRFVADRPNTLWVTDITEHCTSEGTVHCCAMLDVYSRMMVGWSIADHIRTNLVVDALQMACWRRRPPPGTICHGNQGNTLPGRSGTGCAKPDCPARWVGWPRWITR